MLPEKARDAALRKTPTHTSAAPADGHLLEQETDNRPVKPNARDRARQIIQQGYNLGVVISCDYPE